MNRVLYLAFLLSISPAVALAGHWEFDASGLAGAYYGISETKDVGSVDNLANRWVTRADASFKSDYVFQKEHRLGLRADTTLIFKAHDRSRRNGEWRFFPISRMILLGEILSLVMFTTRHISCTGEPGILPFWGWKPPIWFIFFPTRTGPIKPNRSNLPLRNR